MESVRGMWWAVVAAVLVVSALAIDAPVSGWLTAPAIERPVGSAIQKVMALTPVVLLLGMLASFPNRGRLIVGVLGPLVIHLPILHLLKWAIGRARPIVGLGAFHFEPFAGAQHCDAFPSGHSASAGVLALALGLVFPRGRVVFYAWAALVGVERITCGWHFLSDVLAGYALAAVVVLGWARLLGRSFYRLDHGALPGA